MQLSCPVSIGEVLDKISILRIKLQRIKDPAKLRDFFAEVTRANRALSAVK